MAKFTNRFYIVADAAGADWFREYARDILGDDGWETVCRTPLTGNGDAKGEPTHYACSVAVTDEQQERFDELEAGGKIPAGVKIIRVDAKGADAGKIKGATDSAHKAKIGQRMDFDAEVSAMGLARHSKGDPKLAEVEADTKPPKGK